METRVAVLAIIVRGGSSVQPLNELLHQYGQYIIGRMGVPYREKGVNIISVALDAPGSIKKNGFRLSSDASAASPRLLSSHAPCPR